MVDQLPVEWKVDESEKDAIVDYLQVRQPLLRPIFESSFGM